MKVVVVDKNDEIMGAMDRAEAVKQGKIVRIVRIFLFNSKGDLFLQKRGPNVDFPNLWDQSVGGHVDEGENYLKAAKREMREEIGLDSVKLKKVSKYYTANEYTFGRFKRFNMLYSAVSDEPLVLNPDEVTGGIWVSMTKLSKMVTKTPEKFTQGFIKAYKIYLEAVE